jgi:creatinine amidohydrolase
LLPYFAQTQLDKPHDYVVYVQWGFHLEPKSALKKDQIDMHAGQSETSNTMVSRPDLVHLDRAPLESGADQNRVHLPETVYTGIWWYAKFPDHYSGDATLANKELGELDMKTWIDTITQAIRAVKSDDASLRLQNEFYERSGHPLDTKQ